MSDPHQNARTSAAGVLLCARVRTTLLVFLFTLAARPAAIRLWRDPGDVGALDLGGTVGVSAPVPKPPFRFVKEDGSGTQPKLFVRDSTGVVWNVKFGYEVKPECFGWRIPRACGYFTEPSFYVPSGRIEGLGKIRRATPSLHPDGVFQDARFQYRDPAIRFLDHRNWRWDGPPFAGTPQLSGLKILIMLVSNWDNKDGRVGAGGPNTAVFRQGRQLLYAFTDWGEGMGRWGHTTGQTNWRCEDFTAQTADFVKSVRNGQVVFGYGGAIDDGFRTGIPVAHVAWLLRYLGRITDVQLRAALRASGASPAETECFTAALRARIDQLHAACARGSVYSERNTIRSTDERRKHASRTGSAARRK